MMELLTRAMISSITLSATSETVRRKTAKKLSRNLCFIGAAYLNFTSGAARLRSQSMGFRVLPSMRCRLLIHGLFALVAANRWIRLLSG